MYNRFLYYKTTIIYGLKSQTVYRVSAWLNSSGNFFTFVIQIFVWQALLGNGMRFDTSLQEMITYLLLTQIAKAFVSSFSGNTISRLVRNGDIAVYLVRPIKLKTHLLLDDIGRNMFQVLLVYLPICILLALWYGFVWPANPFVIILTLVMLINGMIMLFYYRYTLGLISFWLVSNPFTSWHFQNAESLFSGQIIPIWLCPAWLSSITQFLPFRYFTYEPLTIFIGKTPFEQSGRILIIQFIWLGMLFMLERFVSSRAMHKLVSQGG